MENNVKSLTNEFKMLPVDQQIKVLIEDAKNSSILDKYQDKLIDNADEYCHITININESKSIYDKIKYTKDLVMYFRRLGIPDYYTLYRLISNQRHNIYNNLNDFVYDVFISTSPNMYNISCSDIKCIEQKAENSSYNKSKEDIIQDGCEAKKKNKEPHAYVCAENKPKENHANADVNAAKGITPSSIASVFTNNPQPVEQHKCACGGHHEDKTHTCTCGVNNNQQPTITTIHPELNISQKVDLLKRRITFIPAKVDPKEIDALLWMLEGKMLNSKLMEYQATTGCLIQKADINFDKSQYNFAFEAESNIPGKRIIVLFNTNYALIPGTNQYGYALNIYLDNK